MQNKDDGIVRKLYNAGLLNMEQEWVKDTNMEVITGSISYGMPSSDSDTDVIGICVPPIDYVFPYTQGGYIKDFGERPPNFEVFQQHHVKCEPKQYDIVVYGLIKFFQLAAENNPNLTDVLFVADNCLVHCDNIGKLIRSNRKLFLTRHCYHKLVGYAYNQLKKIRTMSRKDSRAHLIDKYGYDTKYGSHLVRLVLQCEQILTEHDLDLQRNSNLLKAIRNGEWTLERLETWFAEKELTLNKMYTESTLRYKPDWPELTRVLLCALEEKFGSLDKYMNTSSEDRIRRKFEQIAQIVNS